MLQDKKISPIEGGLMVDSLQLTFVSTSKSRDTKTRPNIKFRYCALVLESVVSCQFPLQMAKETAVENGRISYFEGLVTLTLDRGVILHAIVHHSSTSTCKPNFTEIEETMWTDRRT